MCGWGCMDWTTVKPMGKIKIEFFENPHFFIRTASRWSFKRCAPEETSLQRCSKTHFCLAIYESFSFEREHKAMDFSGVKPTPMDAL